MSNIKFRGNFSFMSDVAIYGAGIYGKVFFYALKQDGVNVDFFIDEASNISTYLNRPVLKKATHKDTIIYISPLQSSNKIYAKLSKQGYKHILSFKEAITSSSNFLKEAAKLNHLWLVEDKTLMLDDKLIQVEKLLVDATSKELLEQIIAFRKTLDPKYYSVPSGVEYFPTDVPILDNLNTIKFIDCGAYIGDTIEKLMQHGKDVESCISFEPDKDNIKGLEQTIGHFKALFPNTKFSFYNKGVYSTNRKVHFEDKDDSSGSAIKKIDNNNFISVVSLDEVIFSQSPNYIKMDIEGAEREALIGAKKIIRTFKPNLAICLYHKPQDLWELPLLINKIEASYDMYLRIHEDLGLSTVLYCISNQYKEGGNA